MNINTNLVFTKGLKKINKKRHVCSTLQLVKNRGVKQKNMIHVITCVSGLECCVGTKDVLAVGDFGHLFFTRFMLYLKTWVSLACTLDCCGGMLTINWQYCTSNDQEVQNFSKWKPKQQHSLPYCYFPIFHVYVNKDHENSAKK